MTDTWVPGPPPPPPPPPNGLPPSNSWIAAVPCATSGDNPSIVDGVVITGVPAQVLAPGAWGITLNDGDTPPNFSIDHYDASGALIESPIEISGASGDVTLNHDPTQELGAATKHYVDNTGLREAPMDNTTYGRDNGTWVPLPGSYMPEAPNTTQRYGRFNSIWQLDAIQTDAPSDGGAYARQNGGWTAAVTGGPYLPLTGGTMTGALIMQGSNMIALTAPLTGGGQAAILGQKATVNRWQMMLGDQTAEGVGNAGSNFALNAFSTTGVMLGTWLTIARADGSATFNGSGVTIQGGLAVNGTLALGSPGQFALYGGNPGDALVTNGSGVMSFAARVPEAPTDGQFYSRQSGAWAVAPGGMTDAPNDGTAYARKSQAWAHLTHADITDWAANVPASSSANPLVNGVAAPGSSAAFSRGDHVHPTDTSRAAVTALPPASTLAPLPDGNAAVGVSAAYARADHVHPAVQIGDNRIINGDMRIDQRNNGASGTASGYTCDRWRYDGAQASKGTWGRYASSAQGFPYDLGFTSASAYAVLAGDFFAFSQIIEADMVSDFAWGTANAQSITLSFWAFSSLTGTFGGSIRNTASNRSYPFSYSIPVASTWTRITITIPGDTAGAWVMSGNAAALNVFFSLGVGSTFSGAAGAWASTNYLSATGAVSVVATNGAAFFVTGVKLEIGSIATPFNRQSMAKSLADCQRYYQQIGGTATSVLLQGYASAAGGSVGCTIGYNAMRAAPTAARIGAWTITNTPAPNFYPGISSSGYNANSSAAGQVTVYPTDTTGFVTFNAEL